MARDCQWAEDRDFPPATVVLAAGLDGQGQRPEQPQLDERHWAVALAKRVAMVAAERGHSDGSADPKEPSGESVGLQDHLEQARPEPGLRAAKEPAVV